MNIIDELTTELEKIKEWLNEPFNQDGYFKTGDDLCDYINQRIYEIKGKFEKVKTKNKKLYYAISHKTSELYETFEDCIQDLENFNDEVLVYTLEKAKFVHELESTDIVGQYKNKVFYRKGYEPLSQKEIDAGKLEGKRL